MDLKRLVKNQLKGKKRLAKMPRIIAPKSLERDYERQISDFLKAAYLLIHSRIIMQLPRWAKDFERNRPADLRNDAADDDFLHAMDEVRVALSRQYSDQEIRRLAEKQGLSIAEFNEKILRNGYQRVLGFDVFFAQPYLKAELNMFASLNTKLIVGMRDEMMNRIEKDVMLGFSRGVRHEQIASKLEDYIDPLNGTIRSRAKLIARDQTNKLNSQLTQMRQSELGVRRYVWRTALDERVRDSHREKEGKIYSWDDPPEDTGHPGEDIQCRCYAEPVLSDILETASKPEDQDA